jgi:ABC-type multidrug transport system ATPase subunit
VDEAVRAAVLDRDLPQLGDGLDTIVGERGVNLSGGQRQRAALARVFLMNPRVLILDDTLSAVDTHTADAILSQLQPFANVRTTIVVAHRLSTVQHADNIIVLDEGRIVEQGAHRELIALGGRYACLYAQQQRREASAAELQLDFEEFDPDRDPGEMAARGLDRPRPRLQRHREAAGAGGGGRRREGGAGGHGSRGHDGGHGGSGHGGRGGGRAAEDG